MPTNQSYLDPAADQQRNSIASTLMNIAQPPPQTAMPPQTPMGGAGAVPQMPQMPPPGAPPMGAPVPQMPPPAMPLQGAMPPQPMQGGMPQQMPGMPPRGY